MNLSISVRFDGVNDAPMQFKIRTCEFDSWHAAVSAGQSSDGRQARYQGQPLDAARFVTSPERIQIRVPRTALEHVAELLLANI